MATTNLIADFLIIGVCSIVWLVPVGLLTDFKFSLLNDLGLAPSFALFGAIYVVGICINRLADDIMGKRNNKIRDEVFSIGDNGPSYHTKLNAIVMQSESAANYLSYRRSIIRITRACALNFLIGALSWLVVLVIQWGGDPRPPLGGTLAALIMSILVAIMLARAWPVVLKGYFSSIRDMHGFLSPRSDPE